jgi:uncharacterized protein
MDRTSAGTSRTLKLAAIGTAGGVFSGLLGVGGGSVIVPLLIIWMGYGNVDPPNAALVGVPAIAGALAGTALQQRIPERLIGVLFAVLLVVIAIELIVP